MNCQDTERAILLAETGELSDRKQRTLDDHLSTCPACASYRQNARRLMDSAKESLPAGEPSPVVMARIRAAAAARPAAGFSLFRQPALRALAYAAALAVLAGGWLLWSSAPQKTEAPVASGSRGALPGLRDLVALALETTPPSAAEAAEKSPGEHELRALAKELLILEGLAEDEGAEMAGEETTPTSDGELSPTVLRLRSTAACLPSVCG